MDDGRPERRQVCIRMSVQVSISDMLSNSQVARFLRIDIFPSPLARRKKILFSLILLLAV